ncbi:heme exporter protein CcmD [Phenylobacterium sp. J367]|uniref:heme exporter protein CcmD n=1 Tax=Phenylobacterium sp. J367 TaxID=2898435 RepID=UPI0021509F88|nr:heme exporter protein CcmD [Phenylobacterium sp. J367]MCR5878225.1 heme exporter protein CcmD [Phenylobacterium sp. J367]
MLDLDASPYAAFVWPAFAITALVFAWMVASSLAHARRWKRKALEGDRQRSERT